MKDAEAQVKAIAGVVEQQIVDVLGAGGELERAFKEIRPMLKELCPQIAAVLHAARKEGIDAVFDAVLDKGKGKGKCKAGGVSASPSFAAPAASAPEEVAPPSASEGPAAADPTAAVAEAKEDKDVGLKSVASEVGVSHEAAAAPDAAVDAPAAPSAAPFAPAPIPADASPAAPTVHFGIICDGCNMNPLKGTRYRSKVRNDFDLCHQCFEKAHDPLSNYDVLEKALFRPSRSLNQMAAAVGQSFGHHMRPFGSVRPFGPRPGPMWGGRGGCPVTFGAAAAADAPAGGGAGQMAYGRAHGRLLDARFVKDMSVFDGTEVEPRARFTKIWRLRNSGSVAWPCDLHVMHVGGDVLADREAVPLELPRGGVMPEQEVDVAVEMVAPERPGRYMSHWRLVAPSGTRFGHRFWALIQVTEPANALEADDSPQRAAVPAPADAVPEMPAAAVAEPTAAADSTEVPRDEVKGDKWEDPIIAMIRSASDSCAAVTTASAAASVAATVAAAASTAAAAAAAAAVEVPVEEPVQGPVSTVHTVNADVAIDVVPVEHAAAVVANTSSAASTGDDWTNLDAAVPAPVATRPSVSASVSTPSSVSSPRTEETAVGGFSLLDAPYMNTNASGRVSYPAVASAAPSDPFQPADGSAPPKAPLYPQLSEDQICGTMPVGVAASASSASSALDDVFGGDGYVEVQQLATAPAAAPMPAPGSFVEDDDEDGEEMEMEQPEKTGSFLMGAVQLDQLEGMGFPFRTLNRELLEASNYDMDAVVGQLLRLGEWQDKLDELEEMDFTDKEVNARLMLKHEGSLKHTVRELVAAAKAERKARKSNRA
eukprot:TRINITY_DN4346_c0_g1_i1.p1 TRINITY_DN4346_c0_g1~~TRINITY_DN4346_c0_g1_i1.p1  ORF type:complete len:958 (+),score=154.88 TRINITY_DN4346_c0_g1_i1:403-2874(+)